MTGAILQVLDGRCPQCGGSLDTGYECNNCDFDGISLVRLREACEQRGERMHPSGLYFSEMQSEPTEATRTPEAAQVEMLREARIYVEAYGQLKAETGTALQAKIVALLSRIDAALARVNK